MSGTGLGVVAFLCLFGAAFGGVRVGNQVVRGAVSVDVTDLLRRAAWTIALLACVMLAALTVYLKIQFDTATRDVRAFAFQIVDLDNALRRLGPPSAPAREVLFRYAARTTKDVWPDTQPRLGPTDTHASRIFGELEAAVAAIEPTDDHQRDQLAAVRQLVRDVGRARWTLDERAGRSLSPWLVGFVVLWLILTFGMLGLSSGRSRAALGILTVCAFSISGAIFLAVEYADPYSGVIIVSSEPMTSVLYRIAD